MPDTGEIVVSLRGVSKDYQSLRPLRVHELDLRRGRTTALLGVDEAMAEVLVNLITATTLPDAGTVHVFGRPTAEVTDSDTWIGLLDHFGILSARAVLVEPLTVRQNLTMPHSLDVDDPPADVREAVAGLAGEVGLDIAALEQVAGQAGKAVRARLRLGRAVALAPRVVLAEHPNALVDPHEAGALAGDLRRVAAARGVACLVMTADRAFAQAVADDVLTLEPGTGTVKPIGGGWRRLFGG